MVGVERGRDEFRKRLLAESISDRFGVALLAGDSKAAEQVAQEALELTLSQAMLYDLVVGPAMHRIGQLWAAGEIGVAHEHLATQIATQVLALAHDVAGLPAHRAEHRAMLAAAEGEQHVLALDMAAKLLESAGYEVLVLGADVPYERIAGHRVASPSGAVRAHRDHARSRRASAGGGRRRHRSARRHRPHPRGSSVPASLALSPRVVVEGSVAGIVEAADGLVRRARLN